MLDKYTIDEAAVELSFSAQHIRTLIRQGRLESTMEPLAEGSLVEHHIISAEELERYRNEVPHKSRRSDGRNKFIIYLLATEIAPVRKALEKAGFADIAKGIRPSNKLKSYAPPNSLRSD
jgi:hypothetical protein